MSMIPQWCESEWSRKCLSASEPTSIPPARTRISMHHLCIRPEPIPTAHPAPPLPPNVVCGFLATAVDIRKIMGHRGVATGQIWGTTRRSQTSRTRSSSSTPATSTYTCSIGPGCSHRTCRCWTHRIWRSVTHTRRRWSCPCGGGRGERGREGEREREREAKVHVGSGSRLFFFFLLLFFDFAVVYCVHNSIHRTPSTF